VIETEEAMADPSGQKMMQMIAGYWMSQIVAALAQLGIADRLAKAPQAAEPLAAALAAIRTRCGVCCAPRPASSFSRARPTRRFRLRRSVNCCAQTRRVRCATWRLR
jgi:hypothetical protein